MKGLLAVLLIASAWAAPVLGQSVSARPPETDQTVTVAKGTRLTLDTFAGEVTIRGWDRDAVRIQARHAQRTKIAIRNDSSRLAISASGTPGAVDYDINVPAWMAVKVDGTYTFVNVEGTSGEIAAETVRGDVAIKGGAGFVSGKSIQGEVSIAGAKGRITASSVNEGITVSDCSGEIAADTTNGAITLARLDAEVVNAETVNGTIRYEGSVAGRGRYRLTTHNGNILVGVPENASVSFSVRTYNGGMETNLSLSGGGDVRRGRRVTFTLGGGASEFELETFGGSIQLRRAGTLPPVKPKDVRPIP